MTTASGQPNGLESPAAPDRVATDVAATASERDAAALVVALPASAPVIQTLVGNAAPDAPKDVSVTIPGLSQTLHGIDHELQLLSRTHKYDWVSKRLLVLRNVIIASLLVVVTVVLVVVTYKELTKDVLVINSFDVPARIEERGYSGRVIGRKLFDQITYIRTQTLSRLAKREIVASVWKAESDVAIPDTRLTVGALFAYLRGFSARDTFIDGELTEQGDQIAVTVRQRGKPSRTVTGKFDELDALMLKAAEHILLETQPAILAQFRLDRNDRMGAIEAVRISARADNPEEVALALTLWGRLLQLDGDPAGARSKWEESLLVSPLSSSAWRNISLQLAGQDRVAEAVAFLEQRSRQFPNDVETWGMLSSYYGRVGNQAAAVDAEERALRLNPDDPASLSIKAYRLIYRGDYAAMVAIGERLERVAFAERDIRSRPTAIDLQIEGHLGLRNFDRVLAMTKRNIAEFPAQPNGYIWLGRAQTAMHDYDDAIASHRKSQELGMTNNTSLIQAMTAKGDLDAAQKLAEASMKRNFAGALSSLDDIYFRQGKYAEAAAASRRLIAFNAQYTLNYARFGRTLAKMGDTKGAEEQFKLAIEHGPKLGKTHHYWGEMLAAQGDHAGAIVKYKKALELDSRWGEPYAKWGESLVALGNAETAKEKFAKALELEPKHPDFQKYKAKL